MFLVSSGTCWLNRQLFNYTGGGCDLHCTDSNLLDEIHFRAVPFVSSLEGSNFSFQEMKLVDALLHLLLKVPKGPVLPSACMGRAIART